MKLSTRLKAVADNIGKCKVLADIGCDHGLLTVYALKNNLAEHVIAADVSQQCLDKTIKLSKQYLVDNRVTAVCCNGLDGIDGADTAVIAGMGGREIIDILARKRVPNLVLQPMKNTVEVRQFLNENNYKIIVDVIVSEKNKYYDIIKAEKTDCKQQLSRLQMLFGLTNLENKPKMFLDKLKNQHKMLCAAAKQANSGNSELIQQIKDIEAVLNEN